MTSLVAGSPEEIQALRELITAYRNGRLRLSEPGEITAIPEDRILFGKAAATIAAVTTAGATQVSSASVNVWTFASTGGGTLKDENYSVTAYNLSTIAVTTETWVQLRLHESGNWVISDSFSHMRKPLVRVTVNSSWTQGSSSIAATIKNQWGPGLDNSTTITLRNFELSAGSTYLFAGASGAAFLAGWDSGTTYQTLQGECT